MKFRVKHSPMLRGWGPSEYSEYLASLEDGNISKPKRPLEHKEVFNWGYQAELYPSGGEGKYVEDVSTSIYSIWPEKADLPGFF